MPWVYVAAGAFALSGAILLFCALSLLSLYTSRRYRTDPTRRARVEIPHLRRVK